MRRSFEKVRVILQSPSRGFRAAGVSAEQREQRFNSGFHRGHALAQRGQRGFKLSAHILLRVDERLGDAVRDLVIGERRCRFGAAAVAIVGDFLDDRRC
jgi:hypothetical protein